MSFLNNVINSTCPESSKRVSLLFLVLFMLIAFILPVFWDIKDKETFKFVVGLIRDIIVILVAGVTAEAFGKKKDEGAK